MTVAAGPQGDTAPATTAMSNQRLSLRRALFALMLGSIVAASVLTLVAIIPSEGPGAPNLPLVVAALAVVWTICATLFCGPLWILSHRRRRRRLPHFVAAAFVLSFMLLAIPSMIGSNGRWWVVLEASLLVALCTALGAAVTWFVAYSAPTLMMTGKTRLQILAAIFVGIAISPLLGAAVAGLSTSRHIVPVLPAPKAGVRVVFWGPSQAARDAAHLIAAYDAGRIGTYATDRAFDQSEPYAMLSSSTCSSSQDRSGQPGTPIDSRTTLSINRAAYSILVGHALQYSKIEDAILAEAVARRTTAFGRGLWTACLHSALYEGLCRSHVKSIFEAAYRDSRTELKEAGSKLLQASDYALCRYYDGVRAREMKTLPVPAMGK